MKIEQTKNVETVRSLAARWLSECHAAQFGLDSSLEVVLDDMQDWLARVPGTLLVARDERQPVAVCAVFACRSYLSAQVIAIVRYWYARPNAQQAGPLLYRCALDWARVAGCSHLLVSASHLAGDKHDKIARFCTAQGMKPFETLFLREV